MKHVSKFIFPDLTMKFLIRIVFVAVASVIFFTWILIPFRVDGHSMSPTYQHGNFNFCNRLQYLFSSPSHQDVVAIRYSGTRIMLLKRILAVEGETLEFREGQLFIDGTLTPEPYITMPYDWNLEPRTVKPGHVYVVGDNRRVPMDFHDFGQTPASRIIGAPLW